MVSIIASRARRFVSRSECRDALPEDFGILPHEIILDFHALLLCLVQLLEERIFADERAEFLSLFVEFSFLVDYPLLVWCVCHCLWLLFVVDRL